MKQKLFRIALVTCFFALGWIWVNWGQSAQSAKPITALTVQESATDGEPLTPAALRQHHSGQPHHWRTCLLQQ